MNKPEIAIYGLGACGGCDSALIDLGESLLELAEELEIVIWPLVLDFKHDRIREMADRSISLTVISGGVIHSDHLEMARLLRAKSRLLLACGACACFGGIPGLANLCSREDINGWIYRDAPTVANPDDRNPVTESGLDNGHLPLPRFYPHLYALHQAVEVDYYLPGCPPPSELLLKAVQSLLAGKPPVGGKTLAPAKSLCDSCRRNASKPARMQIRTVRRPHEAIIDPEDCFLAHGVICMGPVTRDGCGGSCLAVNAPCRGCFGPVEGVQDAGARLVSFLAALLDPEDDASFRKMIATIADPAGYGCRFAQAVSILGSGRIVGDEENHDP